MPQNEMPIYRQTIKLGANLVVSAATTIYPASVGMGNNLSILFTGHGLDGDKDIAERLFAAVQIALPGAKIVAEAQEGGIAYNIVTGTGQTVNAADLALKIEYAYGAAQP